MTPLVNNPEPTAQEVLDAVVEHSRTMRGRSINKDDPSTPCLYRGPNGNACFVGALLTDEEAKGLDRPLADAREAWTVKDLRIHGRLPERLLKHVDLLTDLQSVHDGYDPKDWPKALDLVAIDYDLTIPPKE